MAATVGSATELLPSVFLDDYGYIPLVVANAAYVIEKNIRTRGLFHTKGTASKVMRKLTTRCKSSRLKAVNVHDAVDALKTALVSLQDPLLPDHVLEALICVPIEDRSRLYVSVLREFRKCSPHNFAILHFVITLLSKVSKHTLQNGADVQTLAAILVFDFIRPLMRESTETGDNASDLVQRLPFLIAIMETLIEHPEIFKMAATVGDDQLPEAEEGHHHDAALLSAAERNSKADPPIRSGISGSTYSRPVSPETRQDSDILRINDSADAVEVLHRGWQGTADASAIANHAEVNTFGLKDAVLETKGNMQCSPNLSTVLAAGLVVNNGRNLLTAADSECLASREGMIKISEFNSSPGKKPSRAPRPKKTVITRKQKRVKKRSSKRFAKDVEETVSGSSLSSDFETLLLREVISGWSESTCNSDDANSVMIQALKFPKELPSKIHTAKIPEALVDCETRDGGTFNPPQTSPAEQESGTSNRECFSNLILDNRESVNTVEDHETQYELVTINPESRVLPVPRKRCIKYSRKGKLPMKKNRKTLVDLNSRSQLKSVDCFSVSPVRLQKTDGQLLAEGTSKTSSYVTFGTSTEDINRTTARTNVRDSNAAGSDDSSDIECRKSRKSRHLAECATPECVSSGCCCSRHSARCSALVCDNATIHSDNVCVSGCMYCAKCAQSFVSEKDLEQSPPNKGGKGTRSPARLGNEVRARNRSPFVESTPCNIHTPQDLQQIIIVKVISDPPRTFTRSRARGARKKSSGGAQKPQNAVPKEVSSSGSFVEKIFVLSITLFVVSLVLYHLSHSHSQEDRNE